MHVAAKIKLAAAHVKEMIIMGLGESDDAVCAKRLMDSVWDADAELDCLSVLLWLLEDAPASAHPLDDVVKLCKETLD